MPTQRAPTFDWHPPEEFDEYKLLRRLGSGSMGQVHLAHDRLLDRPVAIKFASIHTDDQVARERFLVEARAAARIQHPNVVAIYRIGELDGHPYLVTEFLRGQSLGALELPRPGPEVLEISLNLARGLATAHRHGVLHRDIKLDNAFLCDDGSSKLLDFGLAKLEQSGQQAVSALDSSAVRRPDSGVRPASTPSSDLLQILTEPGPVPNLPTDTEPHDTDDTLEPVAPPTFEDSPLDTTSEWRKPKNRLTMPGALVGTPHYMAPELWRGQPASRASDIYAMGVLMRILLVGSPPHAAMTPYELLAATEDGSIEPTANLVEDLHPELANVVDRCLENDPANRFATGDALRAALEAITASTIKRPEFTGNPYRGLRAFEAEHSSLFFGRTTETRILVERLRAEAFVLVAGDSGVGKSSLCRAGVAPQILGGTLDRDRDWETINLIPGRRPLQSLVAALATSLDFHEASLSSLITTKLDSVGWFIRKKLGNTKGRLLLIDQLEEMVTIADPEEARLASAVLAQFAIGIPGMRTIATVRGDFLTRVAQLPSLGDELMRAIYILRPLSPEALREAITGPAATQGVDFVPDVIDELVDAGREGSLPLLQFALAELWEIRDGTRDAIGRSALKKIGGVTGALARHADGVLSGMLPAQRLAARGVLSRLVTIENTRASLTAQELTRDDPDMKSALEGLVRGRLLVVRETDADPVFEIAHEALIRGWATLTRWLEAEQEKRAARYHLETTAAEWQRQGRARDMLWSPSQLATAQALDRSHLREIEREFLDRSEKHVRRSKFLRRLAIATLPILVIGTYLFIQLRSYRATQELIDAKLAQSSAKIEQAKKSLRELAETQHSAYSSFDGGAVEEGVENWTRAESIENDVVRELQLVSQDIESALNLDPSRQDIRILLADALYERAVLTESMGQSPSEYLARMKLYDLDKERTKKWEAPGVVTLKISPKDAEYTLERYSTDSEGRSVPLSLPDTSKQTKLELPQGSYRITASKPGHVDVFAPFIVGRGEQLTVAIRVPKTAEVPEGFTYIPAGRFLFGAGDRKLWSSFYNNVPLHQVHTDAYIIARYETTNAQWIAFLEALPDTLWPQHLPGATEGRFTGGSGLSRQEDGTWRFHLQTEGHEYSAGQGEPLEYRQRKQRTHQVWENIPVTNISHASAVAYADWLNETGRIPGAHLCSETEWVRATRGADGRKYPHGEQITPEDLNYDQTYSHVSIAMGPDEVGSYPRSVSPFGLHDGSGNVWEWVIPTFGESSELIRGGAFFYDQISCALMNRGILPPGTRDTTIGLRICGSLRESDS